MVYTSHYDFPIGALQKEKQEQFEEAGHEVFWGPQ